MNVTMKYKKDDLTSLRMDLKSYEKIKDVVDKEFEYVGKSSRSIYLLGKMSVGQCEVFILKNLNKLPDKELNITYAK
jgi:hypothetical protein